MNNTHVRCQKQFTDAHHDLSSQTPPLQFVEIQSNSVLTTIPTKEVRPSAG